MIYLDTHVLVWIAAKKAPQLSSSAVALIEKHEVRVSPVVRLELQYLYELGKVRTSAKKLLERLQNQLDLVICDSPFQRVIEQASSESWTRDPFDRIIVAQAKINQAILISRDAHIREYYPMASW